MVQPNIQGIDSPERMLDYFTAIALGWVWAKNAGHRFGDSVRKYNDPKSEDRWPIGSRCVIPPNKAKGLSLTEANWDYWMASSLDEPIAPAAMDDVPRFCKRLDNIAEYVEKIGIGFTVNHNPECPPEFKVTAFHPANNYGFQGPTHAVAACRAIVAAALGPGVLRAMN